MRRPTSMLVAGAGPTGLTLALQAHDHGAHVRIVDRRPEAFRPSRALILHPRTLELLRPLGVSEALLARADVAPEGILHLGSREVRMQLADLALPDTAFPHLSLLRQMDVETVLAQALAERGVQLERGTELVEVWDGVGGVRATLRTPAGMEKTDWDYVAGCDGPASTVRTYAGIGWYGGAYGEEVVLADVELDGDLERDVAIDSRSPLLPQSHRPHLGPDDRRALPPPRKSARSSLHWRFSSSLPGSVLASP